MNFKNKKNSNNANRGKKAPPKKPNPTSEETKVSKEEPDDVVKVENTKKEEIVAEKGTDKEDANAVETVKGEAASDAEKEPAEEKIAFKKSEDTKPAEEKENTSTEESSEIQQDHKRAEEKAVSEKDKEPSTVSKKKDPELKETAAKVEEPPVKKEEEKAASRAEITSDDEQEEKEQSGAHLPIYFWIIAFVFIGVFMFCLIQFSSNETATVSVSQDRTPLSSGMAKGEVNAGGSVFGNNMSVINGNLDAFYEKTGVMPIVIELYVMPGFSENPNFNDSWQLLDSGLYYNENIQTYAFDGAMSEIDQKAATQFFYDFMVPSDKAHLLVVYVTDFGADPTESYYWYSAGSDAATVFDQEAASIFTEELKNTETTGITDPGEAISATLLATADRIMTTTEVEETETNDNWIWIVGLGLVEIVILVGLGVFLWNRSAKETKGKAQSSKSTSTK